MDTGGKPHDAAVATRGEHGAFGGSVHLLLLGLRHVRPARLDEQPLRIAARPFTLQCPEVGGHVLAAHHAVGPPTLPPQGLCVHGPCAIPAGVFDAERLVSAQEQPRRIHVNAARCDEPAHEHGFDAAGVQVASKPRVHTNTVIPEFDKDALGTGLTGAGLG